MLGKRAEVIEMCSGIGEPFQARKMTSFYAAIQMLWQFKNFLDAIGPQRTPCRCNTVQHRNEMLKPTQALDGPQVTSEWSAAHPCHQRPGAQLKASRWPSTI